MNIEDTENQETVTLIASGYEWICPNCPYVINKEVEVTKTVTCRKCGSEWVVADHYHAMD